MKLNIISSLLLTAVSLPAVATVVQTTPGVLADALGKTDIAADHTLVITGSADARDLAHLRNLPATLQTLDLSGLQIEKFSSVAPVVFGRTLFEANAIPPYALFDMKVTRIILPAGTRIIGEGALAHSNAEEIIIPEGVTAIGDYALYDSPRLKRVVLPSTLTSIGKGAFGNTPLLNSINLEETQVASIPDHAFKGCTALESLTLPYTARSIGREAFAGSGITSLDASSVATYAPYALANMTMLEEVQLNQTARYGDGLLLNNTRLQSIGNAPADLPALFAANCANLNPASSVETIEHVGNYAFANTFAQTLTLGAGLTSVGKHAFAGITTLEAIDAQALGANVPEVAADAFTLSNLYMIPLYVDKESSVSAWKSHPVWGQFDVQSNVSTDLADTAVAKIEFKAADGMLTVSAPEAITAISIFAPDGATLLSYRPDTTSTTIQLSNIAQHGDVLLVKVATASNTAATTLIY